MDGENTWTELGPLPGYALGVFEKGKWRIAFDRNGDTLAVLLSAKDRLGNHIQVGFTRYKSLSPFAFDAAVRDEFFQWADGVAESTAT